LLTARQPVEDFNAALLRQFRHVLTYLESKRSRMRYDEYRRQGLPITSSYVESAVKQFNQRAKGTAGWHALRSTSGRATQPASSGIWTTPLSPGGVITNHVVRPRGITRGTPFRDEAALTPNIPSSSVTME
jgi:hypothetical protein